MFNSGYTITFNTGISINSLPSMAAHYTVLHLDNSNNILSYPASQNIVLNIDNPINILVAYATHKTTFNIWYLHQYARTVLNTKPRYHSQHG